MTLLATLHFYANNCPFKGYSFTSSWTANYLEAWHYVRNRSATEPVILKVHNIKFSFDIWLVLYMYFILYSWQLCFSFRKDIMNHRDINLIPLFNSSIIYFNNVIIMTGDFNIRDNNWNLSYSHYSIHADIFMELVDFFGLGLSILVNQVPT